MSDLIDLLVPLIIAGDAMHGLTAGIESNGSPRDSFEATIARSSWEDSLAALIAEPDLPTCSACDAECSGHTR